MRWSCPHCKVSQTIADEKVEAGWSFTRCYKCNGYSLVRKSDVKTFKIAQAPSDAAILSSNPGENRLMSREATEHLQMTLKNAATRSESLQHFAKELQQRSEEEAKTQTKRGLHDKLLPYAIGIAGALAIFSGSYLFMEGQALWKKARHVVREADPVPTENATPSKTNELHSSVEPITDSLTEAAMAPIRETPPETKIKPEIVYRSISLRPISARVNLREEPTLEATILGTATPQDRFVVRQWNKDWFQVSHIQVPNKYYWIRNDFVEMDREN